jgi:Ca-activated chloride channel family protein
VNTPALSERAHHRHRAPASRRRNLASPIVAALAVLVLVTGAGVALSQGGFASLLSANASGTTECAEPVELLIVADTSIAPALTRIAEDFDAHSESCVSTDVRPQTSGDTAALLASNALPGIDAWIPDSSLWLTRMSTTAEALGRATPEVEVGESVATSPVVFAAPASRSVEFAGDQVGWSSLMAGSVGALFPDPEVSSSSLAGLASLTSAAPADDPRRLPSTMIELGRTIPETTTDAVASALAAPLPTVVVMSEHEVVAHNAADPEIPLLALYPSEGTTALDYPFVKIGETETASDASDERQALVLAFAQAAQMGGAFYSAEGFRDHRGAGELAGTGVLPIATTVTPPADAAAQVTVLDQWASLTRRSRMLIAVDVSGSMLEPAGNGLTRMDVYQRAAGQALGRFAGETHLGLWVFSTNRVDGQDWEEVAPVAPLADAAHLQGLGQATATLATYIRGDTGLYDTILAGVTKMRAEYAPGMVNSMVIITDGKNDDDTTIELDALLQQLSAMNDPLKPVPVILVGFGPDSDMTSMQQIAAATGGAAYSSLEPTDLDKVFVDAISQRTCRPNC